MTLNVLTETFFQLPQWLGRLMEDSDLGERTELTQRRERWTLRLGEQH